MEMRDRKKAEVPSSTATRIGLLVGVPIAVVLGVKTLAWAAVAKTWNSGEVLKAADLNATLVALDQRIAALEAGVGNNTMVITATVRGAAGGLATAACPTDYKLTMVSASVIQVTNSGINGWPMGTWGCGNENGMLSASLNNYAAGSPSSLLVCQGLCVR
jgi:hypothetical protein